MGTLPPPPPLRPPPYLEKLGHVEGMKWLPDEQVMEVYTPHALARAVGYLKYARREHGPVLFRGQNVLHPAMVPALFRGVVNLNKMNKRMNELQRYVRATERAGSFLGETPEHTFEPLLQHYGIRTSWLDLVDNFWTALWFGCQEARATGRLHQYLHFVPSASEYAYVVLMQGGAESLDRERPGLLLSEKAQVIDLRRALGSMYLRPHAQHAMLMRRVDYRTPESRDLSDLVVGVIKVRTPLARSWLGEGQLTTTHHVFPPPVYDDGYKVLLGHAPPGNDSIGAIQHIGA